MARSTVQSSSALSGPIHLASVYFAQYLVLLLLQYLSTVNSYANFASQPILNYQYRPHVNDHNNGMHVNKFGLLMDQPGPGTASATGGFRSKAARTAALGQSFYSDDNNYLHEFYADENAVEPEEDYSNNSAYEQEQSGPTEQAKRSRSPGHPYREQEDDEEYGGEKAITAAVFSHHEQRVYKVPEAYHYHQPTVVNLEGKIYPIYMHFNSYSSPLLTKHFHHPTEHQHEETYSRDEPHTHVHTINKPVFHEIRELFTPHKKVYRVIKPMHEKVATYVHQRAKEDHMQHYHMYHRYHGYGHDKRQHHDASYRHAEQ